MPNCNRRDFIKTSGNILSAAALSGLMLSCHKNEALHEEWVGFKYAMCNESMAELSWVEQCRTVSDAGYRGIEIAAFTLVKEGVQEITPAGRKEMVSVMKDAGLECVGLHWLVAPPPKGLPFTTPGADHAQQRSIEILVEPLGKRTTDVVNTLAEASQLAGQVNHPAIRMMFDFNNTVDETEPFDVLLKKTYKNINHVPIQEMGGKHLGTGTAVNDYVKAFQVLKDMRYNHWISLEVFDFSPGGKTIANKPMRTMKKIEGKLT